MEAPIAVWLLGGIEVSRDGRRLPIVGAKLQLLVAMLALSAPHPVPGDSPDRRALGRRAAEQSDERAAGADLALPPPGRQRGRDATLPMFTSVIGADEHLEVMVRLEQLEQFEAEWEAKQSGESDELTALE